MLIGTEIKEGEKVSEKDQATATSGFLAVQTGHQGDQEIVHWKEGDPLTAGKLFVVKVKRKYRKLHVGDKIEKGQLIALLDSTVQISDVGAKISKLDTAESEWRASVKTQEEAIRRAQAAELLWSKGKGFISEDTYRADLLNRDRFIEEEKGKNAARKAAKADLEAALTILKLYEIRSSDSGVIKEILKRPGEVVRSAEPIVRLEVESDAQDERQAPPAVINVPAQREGVLLVVGTGGQSGAKIPANLLVTVKNGNEVQTYRQLRVGDAVEEGDLLAKVDDRLARLELEVQKASWTRRRPISAPLLKPSTRLGNL